MGILKGKKIFVTGGVTGIGRATVLAAVREGAAVVATSRAEPDSKRVLELLDEARKLGPGPVTFINYDVTQFDTAEAVFKQARDFMGGLDTLVYCANVNIMVPAEQQTVEHFYTTLNIHVIGLHVANLAALKHMKEAGGGSIINFSSNAGMVGMNNQSAYSAAKGGVFAYTRGVAFEWGKYGVRVNSVSPFATTEMFDKWVKEFTPEELEAQQRSWRELMPLGGWPRPPAEVADVVVFLASDYSRYMTGQALSVDGGITQVR